MKETVVTSLYSIGAIGFVTWLIRALLTYKQLQKLHIDFIRMAALLPLLLPDLLAIVIPIATPLGVYLNVAILMSRCEISAMHSLGITNERISSPIMAGTCLLTIILYIVTLAIQPKVYKEFKLKRNKIQEEYLLLSLKPQTFNKIGSISVHFLDIQDNNSMRNLTIIDNRIKDIQDVITATSAHLQRVRGHIILEADNIMGCRLQEGTNNIIRLIKANKMQIPIGQLMGLKPVYYFDDPKDKNIRQLAASILSNPGDQNNKVIFHRALSAPLYTIVATIITLCSMLTNAHSYRFAMQRSWLFSIIMIGAVNIYAHVAIYAFSNNISWPLIYIIPLVVTIISYNRITKGDKILY